MTRPSRLTAGLMRSHRLRTSISCASPHLTSSSREFIDDLLGFSRDLLADLCGLVGELVCELRRDAERGGEASARLHHLALDRVILAALRQLGRSLQAVVERGGTGLAGPPVAAGRSGGGHANI